MQRAHRLPLLTVIFNNQQWEAVKSARWRASGRRAQGARRFPLTELTPSPRFEEMAQDVDGHGERVEHPTATWPHALQARRSAAVREGRPAILNVLCQRAV